MNEIEKMAEAMVKAANKILNDARSPKAPCLNAYKDGRDGGRERCSCWRCIPDWY
jgi:hypothetical protein